MTELDAVLVLEELGRAAAPGPVAETAFVAPPLLAGRTRTLCNPGGRASWRVR